MDKPSEQIAVIGAGVAGLTAARVLREHGYGVRVFDKGRSVGGRTSVRRWEAFAFDHGAQYFTVRDQRFRTQLESWLTRGVVAEWTGSIAVLEGGSVRPIDSQTRYVGIPGMNAMAKDLADGMGVVVQTRVAGLSHGRGVWRPVSEAGRELGMFEAVVVALPPAQAVELLGIEHPLAETLASVAFAPCWAVMAGFDRRVDAAFDGAFVHESPLAWIARNNAKPDRPKGESWILHANPAWSREHVDDDGDFVREVLVRAFRGIVEDETAGLVCADAHRWRYALPPEPLDVGCVRDWAGAVAVCGDWCQGARIEGAFLSGLAAAEWIDGALRGAMRKKDDEASGSA